jgi:hypothetical protein
LKVKDIKTIEELPKLTKNPWQKKETRWWRRRRNVEQEINSMGASVLVECWMCVIRLTTCTSRRMYVKLFEEHCYNRSPKEKIIKMQGRILKSWALGRSSM